MLLKFIIVIVTKYRINIDIRRNQWNNTLKIHFLVNLLLIHNLYEGHNMAVEKLVLQFI